jgi:hypothetical protein
MKPTKIIAALLMTAMVILVTGCSPTGWSTKSIPDGTSLNAGDRVTITKTDGSVVDGEYAGTITMPASEYDSYYASSTMHPVNGRYLPSIGQTVRITTAISDTRSWTGQLIGFDGTDILLKNGNDPAIDRIYFASLTSVSDYDGKTIRRSELRTLFQNGSIPLMTALSVNTGESTTIVPLSAVGAITIDASSGKTESRDVIVMDGSALRNTLLQ